MSTSKKKDDFNWKAAITDVEEHGGDIDMLSFTDERRRDSYLRELELDPNRYKPKPTKSKSSPPAEEEGCYIATCVYGSYDCAEVWTLRRFRDNVLKKHHAGRLFIRGYYAVSPTLVRLFGDRRWFHRFWRGILDRIAARLP